MKLLWIGSSLLLVGCPQGGSTINFGVSKARVEHLLGLGTCAEFCKKNRQYFTGQFSTTDDSKGGTVHCDCEKPCELGEFKIIPPR